MFTAALYEWSVAACPVNVFLDIPLANRFRDAALSSDVEIGGFLIGRFEGNKTIVTNFELVDSEHRRGTAYAHSRQDDRLLVAKLAASRKRHEEVVGFFRSHLRPGMFLDLADFHTLTDHFNNPQQVALLVKPGGDGSASGGFFFWQEGEMDRTKTALVFPMHSEELEAGKPFEAVPEIAMHPVIPIAPAAARKASPVKNWVQVGLVAAGAALGGYFLGTSSHEEHFGSRAGDITLNSVPPTPPAAPAPTASQPPSVAAKETSVLVATPEPPKAPPVKPKPHPVPEETARNTPAPAIPTPPQDPAPEPASQPAPDPAPAKTTGAFPHNPNPLPAPSATAATTVNLEVVEDGGIKHAMRLFGALGGHGGQNFQPPQVVLQKSPRIPAEVARELTGDVPVDLKLKVDSTGRVSSVELVSRGSNRTLVQLAGDAAYEWQFQPAQRKDHAVASEVIAHFHFRPQI